MQVVDFEYLLPDELIAQSPVARRDASRLMVLDRPAGAIRHHQFSDLSHLLVPGDLLVLNNSKVLPARLRAQKKPSGGAFEILLLEEIARNDWWCLLRPAKRAPIGSPISLHFPTGEPAGIEAVVTAKLEDGSRRIRFQGVPDIRLELDRLGEIPLPPYIKRPLRPTPEDSQRYQTVYASPPGSVAAPTAGLHFTQELLDRLKSSGVTTAEVTLHVGPGTFAPVKEDNLHLHKMHEERYEVSEEAAEAVKRAKSEKRRVIAVGTTSARVLESAASAESGGINSGAGRTRIFIHPPYRFKIVDGLITNFHLPRSTLLMLVSALASPGKLDGRDFILRAYAEAIRERYRFYSYGDAMLIQ